MGRKIPGRKHHGVRDPEKQKAERLKALKDKINAPPINADDQPVPKSLTKLVELKNKTKENIFKRRNKRSKSKRPVVFEQMPGENDKQFLNRINKKCQEVKREAAFSVKYRVDIKKNPETGEVEDVVKRPKDEIELHLEQVRNQRKPKQKKKKKQLDSSEPKLTKSQKRQKKLKEKKLKKSQAREHIDFPSRESVRFGDIVHAPPSLPAPRRVARDNNVPKPGKKELLLKSLLAKKDESIIDNIAQKKKPPQNMKQKTKNKIIDRKGKRKDLPSALRRQLDRQQKEIIEAYKEIKKGKYK